LNEPIPYLANKQEPEVKTSSTPVPVSYSTVNTTSENEKWTLKEKVIYGLLTAVGIGGTIWLGTKLIKKTIANKEENKSFDEGTPATTAKQIKMAFDNDGWWGTNVTALREALVSVSSQEDWDKIIKSYNKLYSSNLLKDLSDELQSTEYNEMLQIINAKPKKKGQAPQISPYKAWAKRLKSAFDKEYGFFGGTDGDAIVATLNEMPSQKSFIYTGVEYKKLYGTNLIDDLKSESEFEQYNEWITIITKKTKG
jgi:hypothetical protein